MKMLAKFGPPLAILFISASAHGHGISEADKQAMLEGGYLAYVWLGATHMLTGYDHLLFLFGVMFFLTTAREVVKFVTAFTIAHSITLIGATFAGISANYFLIDAVIALSVCYKGFDNVDGFKSYLGIRAPSLIGMVFLFGLIHGFGLSTRLQQLPLGDKGIEVLVRIVSFNVGVELGQIVALLGMMFVLSVWRRRSSFQRFSRVANHAIILAGFLLLLMQLHGKDIGRLNAIKKVGDTKKWEWLVTFDNDKVKENKRLYVFLKPSGEFVAANFTGK